MTKRSIADIEAEWLRSLTADARASMPGVVTGWLRQVPREVAEANISQTMRDAARRDDLPATSTTSKGFQP